MAKGGATQPKRAAVFEQDSDESDALHLGSGSDVGSDSEGSAALEQDEQESEEEEERPKYAQFMDDSDLEEASEDDSEKSTDSEEDAAHAEHSSDDATSDEEEEDDLQQQMKQIPFSALMKARQQLDGPASDDDDDGNSSEPDISDLEEDEFAQDRKRLSQAKAGKQPQRNGSKNLQAEEALEQKRREVRERLRQLNGSSSSSAPSATDDAWAAARQQREQRRSEERKELVKRSNKNAPTEVSSKRPVSRRRNVIETASAQVRDPRFESLSGSVNRDLFAKSYSFLPEMFKDELKTLKSTLAKLKRQETTQAGPKAKSEQALAIREERAKVEAALRRAEGLAGERERRAREASVKGKIKAQNKERVEKGQTPFYPKKSEVKQMLLKDKYDRLAGNAEGGPRTSGQEKKQLKKALERRRKKNVQKERRDMPAGIGFAREGAAVPKRKRMEGGPGESSKRSRF